MADDCCFSFGGRISVTIDGVRYTPSDADIEVEPTNRTVEAKANQDGSPCYMAKPKLHKMTIKFRSGCGIVWNDLLLKCKVDVTAVEEDNNRTHLLTGARITGTPKLNLSSGEVDGIDIEGPQYQMIAG